MVTLDDGTKYEKKPYTLTLNTPIQGAAAEIMLNALVNIHNSILSSGLDTWLVNCVHDEVVVDAHENDVEIVSKMIVDSMEDALLQVFPEASTKDLVEVGVGDNWTEAK